MKRLVKVGAGLTALFAIQLANPTTDTFAQKKSNELATFIEENLEKENIKQEEQRQIEPTSNEQVEETIVSNDQHVSENPIHSEEIVVTPENILGTPPILIEEEGEEVILPDKEIDEVVDPEVVESGNVNIEDTEEGEEVILPDLEEDKEEVVLPEEETKDEEGSYEVDTPSLTEKEDGGYEVLPEEPKGEDGSQMGGGETPLLPEGPKEEVAADSIWTMDGRVVSAYTNGKVEYEFAFRHHPIIGTDPVDLEDAVFYLNLPEGAIFRSATFGGKYDADNHRVYWNNPGGISTSHANFHPLTPRRVNVQLFFEQPEGEKVATAYATYVPKGGTELTTNTVTVQHGFENEVPVIAEGITLKGELAERPGIPASFPILTGERFTYDVSYSMKTDTPYQNAELIVQLSDQLKFDKHVQLTGDFKTYRYDAENHRFIFVFKQEILEAQGVMKINNLYFPNFYTAPGTEGMIQMFLQYNDNETVAINPDVLNAYAEADWDVSTEVVSAVDPTEGEQVTYVIDTHDMNMRDEGSLVLKDVSVVHKLAKEATFKDAYTMIDGQRVEGVYDKETHAVTFQFNEWNAKRQLLYVDVTYDRALDEAMSETTFTYQGLGDDEVTTKNTKLVHTVVSKESGDDEVPSAPKDPSGGEEKPSTGGGNSSTEGEPKPEEKPSTGGGGNSSTEGEPKPEEKPSTGGGNSSTEGEPKPEEKPSTGGGGNASTEGESKPEEKPSTGGGNSSTEGESKPEEKPSTGGGGNSSTDGESKPEEKPSTGGGNASTEGESKPEEKPSTGGGNSSTDGESKPEEKPSTGGGNSSTEGESKPEEKPSTGGGNSSTDGEPNPEEKPSTGGGNASTEDEPKLEEKPSLGDVGNSSESEETPEVSPQHPGGSHEKPVLPKDPVAEKDATTERLTSSSSTVQQVAEESVVQKAGQLPQTNEQVSMWAWLSGLLAMLGGFVLYFRSSKKRSDQ